MKARKMTKKKEQKLLEKFKNSKSDMILIKQSDLNIYEIAGIYKKK